MKSLLLFALFMAACPPRSTPPAPAGDMGAARAGDAAQLASCPATTRPKSGDVCRDLFEAQSHLPCFDCGTTAQGCLDTLDYVYCAKGGCAGDAKCKADPQSRP